MAELPVAAGTWNFTTETAPRRPLAGLSARLGHDAGAMEVAFFSGICNVVFCTHAASYGPTYDLMNEARKQHPKAWSYQRDFWMTGSEDQKPGLFGSTLPNIVRERETRRIVAMHDRQDGTLLHVERFFGHQQYVEPEGRIECSPLPPGEGQGVRAACNPERRKVAMSEASPFTPTLPRRERGTGTTSPSAPTTIPATRC